MLIPNEYGRVDGKASDLVARLRMHRNVDESLETVLRDDMRASGEVLASEVLCENAIQPFAGESGGGERLQDVLWQIEGGYEGADSGNELVWEMKSLRISFCCTKIMGCSCVAERGGPPV